jgi:hypothetical protein
MKICLWVFKIRGFEGGIGIPKPRGPLNSTGAGLLNQKTSKNSVMSFWMKISLWVVGTRILIFFALDPKLVPKTGNLRCGNNKIRETG